MARIEPFENHTETYEEWFLKNRYTYESEIKAIKRVLPQGYGLEVGVGTGRFAIPLGITVGVEPSKKMADIARKRGIEVIEGTAESLPFNDEEFDFLLMVTTVCFIDDLKKAFSEAYRVLKKKGALIIGFVDRETPLGKMYEAHKEENSFYRYATFYTVTELLSLLINTGFKDFRFVQTLFSPLDKVEKPEPVKEGYGEGAFVVIRADK